MVLLYIQGVLKKHALSLAEGAVVPAPELRQAGQRRSIIHKTEA